MAESEKIVAVGLLTEREVRRWGQDLKHIYPVPEDGRFADLLSDPTSHSAAKALTVRGKQ